jgi:hypothetical protein
MSQEELDSIYFHFEDNHFTLISGTELQKQKFGLGLAVSLRLVQALNHIHKDVKIKDVSKLGVRSKFYYPLVIKTDINDIFSEKSYK